MGAGVLWQLADDALVHAIDDRKDTVGLLAAAEEDRLEHAPGVRDAPERCALVTGVFARADVVERLDGADAERALAVHEPDRLLFVDHAQQRAFAWEVAVVRSGGVHRAGVGAGHARMLPDWLAGRPTYISPTYAP